jgi:hypothetical protein
MRIDPSVAGSERPGFLKETGYSFAGFQGAAEPESQTAGSGVHRFHKT